MKNFRASDVVPDPTIPSVPSTPITFNIGLDKEVIDMVNCWLMKTWGESLNSLLSKKVTGYIKSQARFVRDMEGT